MRRKFRTGNFNGFYPDTFVEVTTPFEAAGPAESSATLETMAAAE